MCPDDRDAQNKYKECDKINRRLAFEKAISVEEAKKSALDHVDIEHLRRSNVDVNYTGPRLGTDHRVTPEFCAELMEYFRNQQVLHKKYAYEILFQIHAYFKQAPTLVDINVPDGQKFTICGDIHGQFYDLLNIFKINGLPSESNPYVSFFVKKNAKCIRFNSLKCSYSMEILSIEGRLVLKSFLLYFRSSYAIQIISS